MKVCLKSYRGRERVAGERKMMMMMINESDRQTDIRNKIERDRYNK